MIDVVLTDIEGTTTPIRFVHDVLFPYARDALPALLSARSAEPDISAALDRVRQRVPERDPLATLLDWMEHDRKEEPLKTLQGIIWHDGYRSGVLRSDLYPDVPPALQRWHAGGRRLAVYSSGSEAAQRLIFGHAAAGDLVPLFTAFFDTRIGAKRDVASYTAIAEALSAAPAAILFLSDVAAELDAARDAGLRTCQLLRPHDGAVSSDRHPHAADFDAVEPLLA